MFDIKRAQEFVDGTGTDIQLSEAMRQVLGAARAYGEIRQAATTRPESEEAVAKWRDHLLKHAESLFETLVRIGDDARGWIVGMTKHHDNGDVEQVYVANVWPADALPIKEGTGN
jgi:hypothetical protein